MRRLLLTALSLPLLAQAPELRTTAADRTGLSITIYQNDLAAVRDTRRVTLPAGVTTLAFADLAATIRPKSAYLLNAGAGLKVLERNFEFNLLSPDSLMAASLDQPLGQRDPRTGEPRWGEQASIPYPRGLMNPAATPLARMARRPSAWLIKPTSNVLMRTVAGFEDAGHQNLAYRNLPHGLRASPTLLQTVATERAGVRSLSLLYTTEGLSWHAHYILTLAPDGRHADLNAFAAVENKSGANFPDATFQLVAGEPNIVYDPLPRNDLLPSLVDLTAVDVQAVASGPPVFHEEKLSGYPLFTLDRPVSLRSGQQKQLALFRAEHLPISLHALIQPPDNTFDDDSTYLETCARPFAPSFEGFSPWPLVGLLDDSTFDSASNQYRESAFQKSHWLEHHRPAVQLQGILNNTKANRLGRALPSGDLDIRYQSPEGALIPLGEIRVDGTPQGEDITLPIATARGMSAERRTLSLRRINKGKQVAWEMEVIVTLTNQSGLALPATIREPIFRGWTLLRSSSPGHRSGENAYDFNFTSRPHSVFTLHYRVRTDYQALPEDQPSPPAP